MSVHDALAGQLAVQRQLISEATLQQVLASLRPGASLGDSLLQQGLINAATLQELQADVRYARMICAGCGLTAGPEQLEPSDPLHCPRCRTALILAAGGGGGTRFDTTPGTGRWTGRPTATGSDRQPPPADTPPTFVSTRSSSTPGTGRFPQGTPGTGRFAQGTPGTGRFAGTPGSARFTGTPGSARFPGGGDPSGSMRFRKALEEPGGRVGEFELLEELGRGGMGVVYKARHVVRNEQVALKVLLAGALASKRQLQRFQREISAMTQLEHPNIVTVKDVGTFGENPFFTMELIEGRPLGDLIRGGRLSFRRSAEIAREVALGLQHAHDRDIVHRDIKPDNILVELSGAALITDFGLVRHMDDDTERMTRSGALVGTPYYMSPEQARGKRNEVTGRSDVYALGVVIYYMTCGELPFRGETQMELISMIVSEDPVRPTQIKPEVPEALERIALKCMAKDPDERYANAKALADDLQRYLDGESVLADAPRRPPPRGALLVGVGIVILLAVGIGLGFAIRGHLRAEARRLAEEREAQERLEREQQAEVARLASLDDAQTKASAADAAPAGPKLRQALADLVQSLTVAMELNPDQAGLALQRGRAREALHLFDEALVDYGQAWDKDVGGRVGTEGLMRKTWLQSRTQAVGLTELVAELSAALPRIAPEAGEWRSILQAWHAMLAATSRSDMQQGLAFAEDARRQQPSNATAWALESGAAMMLGEHEQGLEAMRRAVELEPRNALFRANRALIRSGTEEGNEAAMQDLVQALLLDPELTEALRGRAQLRVQRGDYVGASSDLERVIKAEPRNGAAIVMLARVYRLDGQIKKCEALLARAEKEHPDDAEVYRLRVRVHLERIELDEALTVLRRGIAKLRTEPERRELHERLLELADECRRHDALRSYADERLDADPEDAWGLEALGDLAASRGRWEEAASIFARCKRLHPNFPHVIERYVGVQVQLKRPPAELIAEAERALKQFPEDPVVLVAAVQFHLLLTRDARQARALAVKATKVAPGNSRAWGALALVEALGERLPSAFQAARRAAVLDPENYRAVHILGEVHLKRKELDLAFQRYNQALSVNPFYDESVHRVASLLLSMKRFKEAAGFIGQHLRLLREARRRPTKTIKIHQAQALLGSGEPGRAQDVVSRIMEDPPRDIEDRRFLATVLINMERVQEGRAMLEQILIEDPNHRQVKQMLQELDRGQ